MKSLLIFFLDFGNEEFMVGISLSEEDLTDDFGGNGLLKETLEQCQAECLGREKLCFGWTFDNFDEKTGKGTCYLKHSSVCCNQNAKKKVKEGAISGFTCDICDNCISCWSTSGVCPCRHDVFQLTPQFCSGCSDTEVKSAFVSFSSPLKSALDVSVVSKIICVTSLNATF